MALKNQVSNEPCELGFFERLNYYFGKLMTVRDFKTEQSYFNEKRWLLNRMTTGWGVVCGLQVEECNAEQVKVNSGLALDQYGNEILVCQPILVDLPKDDQTEPEPLAVASDESQRTCFICIRYMECLAEPVPNPVEECGSMKTECEYNRIRETYEIKAIDLTSEDYAAIIDQCEHPYNPDRGPRADCSEFLAHPCTSTLQECPERKNGWIVLAKVVINGAIIEIDNCCCRRFVLSNDLLFQMASCLREQLYGIRTDRRQFVPLLAQTLRGLKYRDGKIKMISNLDEADIKLEKNIDPFSITTDGDFVWFTDAIYDQDQETYYLQKLGRDGNKLESIPLNCPESNYPGWGIAFDGVYMWVTHITPDKNLAKLTRINVWNPTNKSSLALDTPSDAREIVFDGRYMWISHENSLITQVDSLDPSKQVVHDWTKDKIAANITDLAYDGHSLWIGFDANNGLIKVPTDSLEPSDLISISDGNPKGICFDGTHIWVAHEYGISKIDIDKLQQIDIASVQKFLTRVAFDGMYMWVLQPKENRASRIEIFDAELCGGVQTREIDPKENYEISRICFDGTFMWITAFLQVKNEKSGIIYRLLI